MYHDRIKRGKGDAEDDSDQQEANADSSEQV